MVKIQADEKSSHATLRDPLKLPLTKQTIEMLPPVLHAVIYCREAPSAAWQGATASPKLLPPAPRTAGMRPALLPGLAMLPPPLWEDEKFIYQSFIIHFAAKRKRHQAWPVPQPARLCPAAMGSPGSPAFPSWRLAPGWSLFGGSGAHAGLAIQSGDGLCSKEESRRCGSFSSLGHSVNRCSCFIHHFRVSLQNPKVLQQQKTLTSTVSVLSAQLPARWEYHDFFRLQIL